MRIRQITLGLLLTLALAAFIPAADEQPKPLTPEKRKGEGLEAAREDPLAIRWLLVHLPKGADLDLDLIGSAYAESYIRIAADERMCVHPATYVFSKGPKCLGGAVPVRQAYSDQAFFDAVVRSLSMQDFSPAGTSLAREHFAAALRKLTVIGANHLGELLDEVVRRAAAQNEQYIEVGVPFPFEKTRTLAAGFAGREDFSAMRQELLQRGLAADVEANKQLLDSIESVRRQRQHCGAAGEAKPTADYWLTPPCTVKVRFMYQVSRENPPELFFAQALLGHEMVAADPRVVGLTTTGREDNVSVWAEYQKQMQIFEFLRGVYPAAQSSFSAGELPPNGVPPEERCCHVRQSIETGKANRIVNAGDLMFEYRPHNLMRERIRAQHGVIELRLTSNLTLLAVTGKEHPLPTFQMLHIPTTVSTGHEGLLRTDITREYVHAAYSYGLRYVDLKRMVRSSLEYSFLPGASMWDAQHMFETMNKPCATDVLGSDRPSPPCAEWLKANEKARDQWELERRLHVFEMDP